MNAFFRDSNALADWEANKDFNGLCVANHVQDLVQFASDTSLPEEIHANESFYNYLHKNSGANMSTFKTLTPLLKGNSGFSLHIAGH